MRVVQLENKLVEEQETHESLEAELAEQRRMTGQSQARGEGKGAYVCLHRWGAVTSYV